MAYKSRSGRVNKIIAAIHEVGAKDGSQVTAAALRTTLTTVAKKAGFNGLSELFDTSLKIADGLGSVPKTIEKDGHTYVLKRSHKA